MPVSKAPIVLFTYKRPVHTERTLESLSQCEGADESELFIFCDGAKRAEDIKDVSEVRRIVKSRKWCGTVHIIERDENWGLAKSIIYGVTEVVNKYGRVIILEDDLILSRYFVTFMNEALTKYEDVHRVMHVSGFMFNLQKEVPETVFLRFPDSWGWATWKRAWRYFCEDTQNLLDRVSKKGIDLFTINGRLGSYNMLEGQKKGLVDSWAVRWYASLFLKDGLVLYPGKSLVKNIGLDGTGVHCGKDNLNVEVTEKKVPVRDIPLFEDPAILEIVLKARGPGLVGRIKSTIGSIFVILEEKWLKRKYE